MSFFSRLITREIRSGGAQAATFIICVALSISTLSALNSFTRDVQQFLKNESRALHGGDIIVHSHYPIADAVKSEANTFRDSGIIQVLETYEFYTVIRSAENDRTVLANVKSVPFGYPLYGRVELDSPESFADTLVPGSIVVAAELLDRLGVDIGSELQVGRTTLRIAGVVKYDSTLPVEFFSFGPRVFLHYRDLDRVNLMGRGSRAAYELLIKITDPKQTQKVYKALEKITASGKERIFLAEKGRSRLKRFYDNMLFFLSFISIFTLLLSGIGMHGSLRALLRQKQQTIAAMKAVGATHSYLVKLYLSVVIGLGGCGCILGLTGGYLIKNFLPLVLADFLPGGITYSLSMVDVIEGLLFGLTVVLLFTYLPLFKLGRVKPISIFRHEITTEPYDKRIVAILYGTGLAFFSFLVILQLKDVRTGAYFIAGLLALIFIVGLVTTLILVLLKRLNLPWLTIRQSLKSLFRPGNATRSIIVTLSAALAVIMTIFLLKVNLFTSFIESYPKDAPNLFALDIQKDQTSQFESIVGRRVQFFPVIRARLNSINGEPIDHELERKRKSDNLSREFNLTYRDKLLDDEVIVQGNELYGPASMPQGVVQVSVLDTIAEIGGIKLGDRLVFNIQGVPIEAQVTSIRSRTKSKLYPFFYFVFKTEVLESAPQTLFAALNVDLGEISETISGIVKDMPQVSTINAAEVAGRMGVLMQRLSAIITFFSLFSIIAGILIMISSILSTQIERVREAVYYKILGAKHSFLLFVVSGESGIIALLSAALALCIATSGSWWICSEVFDIPFDPNWPVLAVVTTGAVVAILLVGLLSSRNVLKKKPSDYLRQEGG